MIPKLLWSSSVCIHRADILYATRNYLSGLNLCGCGHCSGFLCSRNTGMHTSAPFGTVYLSSSISASQ